MRKAKVYCHNRYAGTLLETVEGNFSFTYEKAYLADPEASAISLTIPKSEIPYESENLPAFFDGLIPEGWLLEL